MNTIRRDHVTCYMDEFQALSEFWRTTAAWGGAVRDGLRGNAGQRLAFRQGPRKALALHGSPTHRGSRTAGPHLSTSLPSTLHRTVFHGGHCLCLSPYVLGDSDRNPEPVGRGGRSGNGQRYRQRSRFCGPLPVRLPEHANGIFFVRAGPDDGLSTCRRAAHPVYSPELPSACPLTRISH